MKKLILWIAVCVALVVMTCPLAAAPAADSNGVSSAIQPGRALLVAATVGAEDAATTNAPQPFRFGVSRRLLRDVNESDAKAAVKVYTQALVREEVFPAIVPVVFESETAFKQALENAEVEGLSLTIEEYASVRNQVGSVHVFNLPDLHPPGEEYLVLVRRDDPAKALRDLQGESLILFDNSRTVPAARWLDVTLLTNGLAPARQFFKSITQERKLTAVVLPVFFRKVRACLTTRTGLETMTELNPQVGKTLRTIAQSPPYISVVMAFAPRVDTVTKQKLLDGISRLHERPSGQQILTIFQAGKQLVQYPESCLQPTLELIATHQRLSRTNSGVSEAKTADPTPAPKP